MTRDLVLALVPLAAMAGTLLIFLIVHVLMRPLT
jgi:hypothetical protein